MSAPRIQTGDLATDVNNERFREAEERVMRYFLAQGKTVTDLRGRRGLCDFMVGPWTVDVKCDQRMLDTGTVAWETEVVQPDGKSRPGWGVHEKLHYVAYVGARTEGPWKLVLVRTARVREALAELERLGQTMPVFRKHGKDGRVGIGYTLALPWLRKVQAITKEAEL